MYMHMHIHTYILHIYIHTVMHSKYILYFQHISYKSELDRQQIISERQEKQEIAKESWEIQHKRKKAGSQNNSLSFYTHNSIHVWCIYHYITRARTGGWWVMSSKGHVSCLLWCNYIYDTIISVIVYVCIRDVSLVRMYTKFLTDYPTPHKKGSLMYPQKTAYPTPFSTPRSYPSNMCVCVCVCVCVLSADTLATYRRFQTPQQEGRLVYLS